MCSRIEMDGDGSMNRNEYEYVNSPETKHKGIRLLSRVLKRVIKRDDTYIRNVLLLDEDPDRVVIRHNGTEDYGKIVYVIKENTCCDGFCATLLLIMCDLIYAKQHGFAPVIRLTSEYAYYDEEKSKEIKNPWEYYFLPEEEAYDENRAMHVSYANYTHRESIRKKYGIGNYRVEEYYDETIRNLCAPVVKKYFRMKPEIIREAEDLLGGVKTSGGKVLGIHFRGTDFKEAYDGHPVFVDADRMIEEIGKVLASENYKAVFLATDDASFGEKLKNVIGDALLLQHADVYRSDGNRSVAFSENERKYHHYLLGREIARDMYTLSLCDGLLAGKSMVGLMSYLFKCSRDEAYATMHIIDNGNHSNGRFFQTHREK